METYRLFIAAELPPPVKTELVAIQERLQRGNPPVRWVAPEAMHLTLHFLGETDAALLPQLGTALRAAAAGHAAIELHLAGAGAFPNLRQPGVLWVGVGGAVAALQRLQAAVETSIAALGLPRESRPFHPHLTLGRVRRDATPAQRARLGAAIQSLPPIAPTPWTIEQLIVFRSQLASGGPIYTELDSVPL